MTTQEKREDTKTRIIRQLKGRVKPHRSASKVLDIAIALTEERVELLADQQTELEWQVGYMKGLDAEDIEPDEKS